MPSTPVLRTARALTDQVAARFNDPHWSVHEVVDEALLALRQGRTIDEALAWMDALGPAAARVRDPLGRGLGLPLCCDAGRSHEAQALVLLDGLVARGLDVNAAVVTPKNSHDRTATMLEMANEYGLWPAMALRLLDHGAPVGTTVGRLGNNTLMHLAMDADSDPTYVGELARRGVPLNEVNESGKTPLLLAIDEPDDEVALAALTALLAAGADPNTLNRQEDGSPLLAATMRGDLAMVEALLAAGAEPDLSNVQGETPLMKAVAYAPLQGDAAMPRVPLAQRLIAAGADVNAQDLNGDTVAARASGVRTLNKAVLHLLAEHGADMETPSKNGFSARHRLENRASRQSEITPDEAQVLVDTAAVRRALIDLANPSGPVPTAQAHRTRARL